ncbi:MAG: hypothetical protein GY941_05515 [Planctomycetes bacterium]|nr:hypothetical protein [Planctomycetota bacterium]
MLLAILLLNASVANAGAVVTITAPERIVIPPCGPRAPKVLRYDVAVFGLNGYDISLGLHGYNVPSNFSLSPDKFSRWDPTPIKKSTLKIKFPCTASNTFHKEHKLHVRATYGNNKMIGSRDFEIVISSFKVDAGFTADLRKKETHLQRNSERSIESLGVGDIS